MSDGDDNEPLASAGDDPEEIELHMRCQQSDKGIGMSYQKAEIYEDGLGNEQLMIRYSPVQAQTWVNTLQGQFDELKRSMDVSLDGLDEVYLVYQSDGFGPKTVDSVAITEKRALERKSEIRHEKPMGDAEVETVTLLTDNDG